MSALPDWMPADAWAAFLEMRKKAKKAPTEYAVKLLVKFLTEQKAQGADVEAILNQSIQNNWIGLFAVSERGVRDFVA